MTAAEPRQIFFIYLNDFQWGECPMCEQDRRLNYCVGWYEGPVRQDPGETLTLPNGEAVETCGMCVCRDCHDDFYEIAAPARPDGR